MTGNTFRAVALDYVSHTKDAVLVSDGDKQHWLPRSCIQFNNQPGCTPMLFDGMEPKETFLLEVPEWLLEKHGLDALVDDGGLE